MTPDQVVNKWARDPVSFVQDVFGAEPDNWQIDVLNACAKDQRIAMPNAYCFSKTNK